MNYIGKISKSAYNNCLGSVSSTDNRDRNSNFGEVLKSKFDYFSEDKCSNRLKGAVVASMLQSKINSMSDFAISDITRIHYPTEKEPGERVFETFLPGTGIRVNISLRPFSMDDNIDQSKLRKIFKKVFMFCEKVLPIEQKLSTGQIEAMGIMALPFDPETGEVDFKTYFKGVFEVGYARIRNSKLDESVKEELIKMLMECEKSLFEALDEEEKRAKGLLNKKDSESSKIKNNKALQTV